MKNNPPSLLSKASQLGAAAALAVAAASSAQANLTLDYSAGANLSSSGFFTGAFSDDVADGIIIDDGFKLWGEMNRTDSMFWRYDSIYDRTAPAYDTTGIAMVWGGRITGATTYDDVINAPYDFSVFFTHQLADDDHYTYTSGQLTIGYREYAYEPEQSQPGPSGNSSNYNSYYFSFDEPGDFNLTGDLSVNLTETDADTDLFWFVQLEVHFNHEFVSSRWWDGTNYSTLDGDTMKLTVPQNSIDVTFDPILGSPTPPTLTPVPEPSTLFSGIAALFGAGFLAWRRRRSA